MNDCLVVLINDDGERTEIFGQKMSITQNEFFSAGQTGLKPKLKLKICKYEYDNEKIAEIDERKYQIYRTYEPSSDRLELYLTEKKGLK